MKKLLSILFILILVLIIIGCYNYSAGSQYGRLEEIKFYNLNNEEIEGEYKDYFRMERNNNNSLLSLSSKRSINSPAPIYLYYCADINESEEIIVRFKIKCSNGYEFYNMLINDTTIYANEFYSVKLEDGYTYVEYICNNINETQKYEIKSIELKKEIDGVEKVVRGSIWQEGRTYISGFLFNIKNRQEEKS